VLSETFWDVERERWLCSLEQGGRRVLMAFSKFYEENLGF